MFKFFVILHKNYLLFVRRWVQTLLVILIPILLSLILVLLRNQSPRTRIPTAKKWTGFVPDFLPRPPNRATNWWLAYTPNDSHISTIVHKVEQSLNLRSQPFASEDDILTFFHRNRSDHFLGAIVFNLTRGFENQSYTIRLRNEVPWLTRMFYPPFAEGKPRSIYSYEASPPAYLHSGFLTLQSALDREITSVLCGSADVNFSADVSLKRMPYPPYLDDGFIPVIQQELCFVIVLGFMFPVLFAVRSVLVEKYGKMKESLKMLGMSNGVYWSSWSMAYMSLFAILCGVITCIFCLPLSSNGAILVSSNPLIVFMLFMLYAHSLLSFGFALSTLFDSPHSGTAVSCAVLILIFLPYSLLHEHYNELSQAVKIISSLLPSCAFGFVCRLIGQFEGVGIGAQFSTLFTPANPGDGLSLGLMWIVLICESQLFTLFALYVDAVWPGKYGVPRPWHFPITCLCRFKPTTSVLIDATAEDTQLLQAITPISDSGIAIDLLPAAVLGDENNEADSFEPEPIGLPIGIALRNVRKVYNTKQTTMSAVSGLTMNVFHGQITVLLGHNGAGKTTTLSILTGLFPPTSGTAFVGGHDIRKDIDGVRKSLGFCPQHDVYFRELTVEEHLKLVARMKGIRSAALSDQVEKILQQTHLRHKRHARAGTLSGGMRRRLSIGMALIGNSQVVILDEPTSGLDPEARRQIWTILQEARACRTVLVTTHYMDEADHLGDRIAILAAGKLKCLGSPLFLKAKYGAGYLLVIVKHPDTTSSHLLEQIRRHIPTATIRSDEGTELKVLLPLDSVGQFATLFKELEEYREVWGVMSFGISITTMEEVFFQVSEGQINLPDASLPRSHLDSLCAPDLSVSVPSDLDDGQTVHSACTELQDLRNDGISLYWQQLVALLSKRGIYLMRHRLVTLSQLLVPIGLSMLAMLIFRHLIYVTQSDEQALPLSIDLYGEDLVITYADESNTSSRSFLEAYLSQFDSRRITGRQMNQTNDYEDSLITEVGQPNMFDYRNRYVIGLVTEGKPWDPHINMSLRAYFQGELFHTAPITLNAVSNGLLRFLSKRASVYPTECPAAAPNSQTPFITVLNHPLPITGSERIQALNTTDGLIRAMIAGIPLVSNLLLALSYLAASFALALVHEYATNAKHLQFVSGVKLIPYWMSNYLWDMFIFLLVSGGILSAFAVFNFDAYSTQHRLYLVAIILLVFAWAILPQMYLLARFFKSPTSGLVWLTVLNHISAVIGLLLIGLLSLPSIHKQELAFALSYFWLSWSPTFALADGLFLIFQNYQFRQLCDRPDIEQICEYFPTIPCCLKTCTPFCAYWTANDLGFARGGIGPNLCALTAHGLLFGFLVLFLDSTPARRFRLVLGSALDRLWYKLFNCGQCLGRPSNYDSLSLDSEDYVHEDEDVRQHRHRISSMPLGRLRSQTCLAFLNVSKTYGSHRRSNVKPAVDRLTFAILPGECFGLLGVNGAGKTTTFRMLTGDLDPSDGMILVNGFDLNKDLHKAQQSIGYCPQFDALLPYLTGRETLQLYARLRGLHEDVVNVEVNRLLSDFRLDHYADVLVSHYSGGKRRKLSVAVSLVGGTPLICLDEPTTGVDPVSRRRMWNILLRCRRQGRTLILSSHSMEECEALCSRVSIVVNGRLKCLGTCQHLKARFGRGYSLTLQVASPSTPSLHTNESTSDVLSGTTDSLSTGVMMEAYRMQQLILDEYVSNVDHFVHSHFPGARLVDRHQGVVQYHLPISLVDDLKLSTIFALIESNKTALMLVNYSVSQTTLENVFIDLAKRQTEPTEQAEDNGLCSRFRIPKWWPCCCRHSQTLSSPSPRTHNDSERESLFS